jgi:hypothetical protein
MGIRREGGKRKGKKKRILTRKNDFTIYLKIGQSKCFTLCSGS